MKYVLPYNMGSSGAKALASKLNILRIKGSKRLSLRSTVINWGSSLLPNKLQGIRIINKPQAVAMAVDKSKALPIMKAKGVSVVDHTTDASVVDGWIEEGATVFARTLTRSSQGKGIVVLDYNSTMVHAPIYTKYIPKCHEFRVHVCNGQVIDFIKKKRSSGGTTSDMIRSHGNGWIFCRTDVTLPDVVKAECIRAVNALGLDFGAVDVLYKERDNKAWVLEVNTAPGLEGTTLEKYSEALCLM